MSKIKILIFFFWSLCTLRSQAQRFPFFNLKVENGLVQSQATCLTQDEFGNLWIGTLGGLSRYDGKKIVNYTVSDGLLSNLILNIKYVQDNNLYISTSKGLQVFDGKKFTEIKTDKQESLKAISQIVAGKQGRIYLLHEGRLYMADAVKKELMHLPVKEVLISLYYKNKVLRAVSNQGIVYTLDEAHQYTSIDSITQNDPQLFVLKTFEDSKGKLWLLCNKGLYFVNNHRVFPLEWNGKMAVNVPVLNVAEDAEGQLWMTTLNGVVRMGKTGATHFDHTNGLTDNIVYDILCDREGNIWMSTDGEGVFRYSGGPFVSMDDNFGLLNKQVTGITGDHEGTLYFSSYQGKLSRYKAGSRIENIPAPEIGNSAIGNILWQDGEGLWIGTGVGLYKLQNNRLKREDLSGFTPLSQQIATLYTDRLNRLFVGLNDGFLQQEDKSFRKIEIDNAAPVAFADIGPDSVLVATKSGFWLYHQGVAAKWNAGTFADSIMVQCMVATDNELYIGTREGGIIIYGFQKKSTTVLNSRNGLSSDFIYNIIKDRRNRIWAGTGRGICKIEKTSSGKFAIKTYGKDNGIIGLESNSNAAFAAQDGHLWFGTTEGVSCYVPDTKPIAAAPAHIVLESVKLFGGKDIDSNFYAQNSGWYNIPQKLNLPYRFNNISFSFQAITLSPVDKILYRYILEGSGKNWSEWSEENTINFLALDPGAYTLKVVCMINGKIQEQTMMTYAFTIRTPFHKSIWFVISIFVLAILFGVYLQYSANKRRQRRQQREDTLRKEEQSRVRERTAEDFHDEVGNKLTRINVLTNVLKSKLGTPVNTEAVRIIQQIQDNSQQLYAGTRDILWSLQPSNDNLYEIIHHVRDLATELCSETEIRFSVSGNEESLREYKMPLDKSRNFIMIWKEALNNCMKYSDAKQVMLQVSRVGETIQVRLIDDGAGFDLSTVQQGNGLKNMSTRAARMEAGFEILSRKGFGTQVILNLKDNNK